MIAMVTARYLGTTEWIQSMLDKDSLGVAKCGEPGCDSPTCDCDHDILHFLPRGYETANDPLAFIFRVKRCNLHLIRREA